MYRTTRDLATVGRLMLHAEGSDVTVRYAMGANAEVDRAAVAAFSAALATAPTGAPSSEKLPREVAKSGKSNTCTTLVAVR